MWKTLLYIAALRSIAGVVKATVENFLICPYSYSQLTNWSGMATAVDLDRIWQSVLGDVEISLSHGNYVTWFKNTALLSLSDDSIVIGVPNIFSKSQLEKKYATLVQEVFERNHLPTANIRYKVYTPTTSPIEPAVTNTEPIEAPKQSSLITSATPKSPLTHTYRRGINRDYTFESFVVGSGNELAYAACQAIAAEPGTKYNPLFLYGGVGIGKTHLIQAVGNAVLAHNPSARVVYITSEQFVQEFVDALRFKKNTDFAGFYRGADVLIIDDIQFIAGKEKIQEEFFHTFNALRQANKQIILSSDKPPKDITALEDRLRSRFLWGMTIDMQNPDFETRCAILQLKADSRSCTLPSDVTDYLATNVQTNIRELEGALNQLLAICEMRAIEPTLAMAQSVIGASRTRPKHLSAKQIIEVCAKHFQVPVADILSPKRDKDIVQPRHLAMYLMRSELHLSFPKIAQELGRKDHTTAIHSVTKLEIAIQSDTSVREAYHAVKEQLYV